MSARVICLCPRVRRINHALVKCRMTGMAGWEKKIPWWSFVSVHERCAYHSKSDNSSIHTAVNMRLSMLTLDPLIDENARPATTPVKTSFVVPSYDITARIPQAISRYHTTRHGFNLCWSFFVNSWLGSPILTWLNCVSDLLCPRDVRVRRDSYKCVQGEQMSLFL